MTMNFDYRDCLKLLFEPKESTRLKNNFMCYFRPKKKAQTEMKLPETLEFPTTITDDKYNVIASHNTSLLRQQGLDSVKPLMHKTKARFNEACIEDEELSKEGYHKLFGLKHVDVLTDEEAQDYKSRIMFDSDFKELEEQADLSEID
jgi:hypothetical protein